MNFHVISIWPQGTCKFLLYPWAILINILQVITPGYSPWHNYEDVTQQGELTFSAPHPIRLSYGYLVTAWQTNLVEQLVKLSQEKLLNIKEGSILLGFKNA